MLWRTASTQPLLVFLVCALAGAGILLAAVILRFAMLRAGTSADLPVTGCLMLSLLTAIALAKTSTYDPAYEMAAFQPLCTYIQSHVEPADVLIVQPYPGPAWLYLMNAECGQRAWYSLPYREQPASATELISPTIPAETHYWLIQQFWSNRFTPETSSLAPAGDRLLQQQVFYSPYHLFVGAYERGPTR